MPGVWRGAAGSSGRAPQQLSGWDPGATLRLSRCERGSALCSGAGEPVGFPAGRWGRGPGRLPVEGVRASPRRAAGPAEPVAVGLGRAGERVRLGSVS